MFLTPTLASPFPQGIFVKRHKLTKDVTGGFFTPADFSVGGEVTIYGRTYYLVDADAFTRQFYQDNAGIDLAAPLPYPDDPVDAYRATFGLNRGLKTGEQGHMLVVCGGGGDSSGWGQGGGKVGAGATPCTVKLRVCVGNHSPSYKHSENSRLTTHQRTHRQQNDVVYSTNRQCGTYVPAFDLPRCFAAVCLPSHSLLSNRIAQHPPHPAPSLPCHPCH